MASALSGRRSPPESQAATCAIETAEHRDKAIGMKGQDKAGGRAFLKVGGSAAAGLLGQSASAQKSSAVPGLPTRNLGLTSYKVGIFSLGGQAALERANNQ